MAAHGSGRSALLAGWLALVAASSPSQPAFTPELEQAGQEGLGTDAQPGSSAAALAAAVAADTGDADQSIVDVDTLDPSGRIPAARTFSRRRDVGRRTPQPVSEAPAAPPGRIHSRRQDRGSSQRASGATEEPELASLGAGYRSALRRSQKANPAGEERWVEQQAVGVLPLFGASQRSVLLLATWLLAPLLGCVLMLLGVRMAGIVLEDGARPLLGAKRGRRGTLTPPTGAAGGTLAARELLRVLLAVWPECTRCCLFRRWGHLASQADMEMGCFEPLSGGGGAGGSSGSLSGSIGSGVDGGGGGGGGDGVRAGAPSAAAPATATTAQSPAVTRRSLSGRTTGEPSPRGARPAPLRLRPGTATPSRGGGALPEIVGSETVPARTPKPNPQP